MACVLQREEKVEINGKAEKERKAMLAMRHYLKESDRQKLSLIKPKKNEKEKKMLGMRLYLKESDRQGIEFDKTNFAHSQHSACQRT